jgi:dihydropteroate synthase
MIIGYKDFNLSNTHIMGILNVTPDSFSDGGKWDSYDAAMSHAQLLLDGGTDIIDVGGESTRPGHLKISAQEEIERVAPIVEALKKNFDAPVSIDTYKSEVAEAAFKAGADMVNDIWGFQYDDKMAPLVKKYDAACCLMHNREKAVYEDFLEDVHGDLIKCINKAKDAGIADDRIILDPGVGFGKTYEMNLTVMSHLDFFNDLGYPLLLGTSRKSFIGWILDLPPEEREEGTLVTTVMAVQSGYSFVRVHDAEKNRRAIKTAKAILSRRDEEWVKWKI